MTDFSLQNIQNRANGQYFENLITEALEYYYEKGYAFSSKQHTFIIWLSLFRIDSQKGFFSAIFQHPHGFRSLFNGCIIFEAKYTDCDRIQQTAVTDAQTEIFERYQNMNARCYVMVCMQGTDFFRVPWDVWKGMKKLFGHKYMSKTDLEKYRIKYKQTLLLLEGLELREYH